MRQIGDGAWKLKEEKLRHAPMVKVPLQFTFEPVEIISKELTKLNSPHGYRIHYLGPRWENSALVHKKYAAKHGYEFDHKRINHNSTFLSETMGRNEFYRSQVYYRAFEGMNPTIDQQKQLKFDSRFQGGNLDCVIKVSEKEYDMFLRIDSNTKGHLFWFYFQVANGVVGEKVRFNLCNLTKSKTLYEKGFKPYCCVCRNDGPLKWSQSQISNVELKAKKLRYDFIYQKIKVRSLYCLSFQYQFEDENPVKFAYCIPYTYSNLRSDLQLLKDSIEIGYIGKSLTGVDIPVVKVGQFEENVEKSVVFMMGRIHPGESNGSIVLSGLMKHLCLSAEASYLRKKIVTIIVPMINPDGVILGNSRTGAAGRDLNRQFRSNNRNLFPQVTAIKRLVQSIQQVYDIELFLDFHGHSRKKNMFFFGPNYNITQPEYYKARIIPKHLAQLTSIFRYYGCDYNIPISKQSTARAVMLTEMNIPYVYTVQTSVGIFFDAEQRQDISFTTQKWEELGANLNRSIKQYFQNLQQYEDYFKSKSHPTHVQFEKKLIKIDQRGEKAEKHRQENNQSQTHKKLNVKDVKLLKIIEEIKAEEKKNWKKKEDASDADSDSQNQDDNLEKMKMAEFQGMVTQCIQVEKTKRQVLEYKNGFDRKKKGEHSAPKTKRIKNKRKQQSNLLSQYINREKMSERKSKNEEVSFKQQKMQQIKQQSESYDITTSKKVLAQEKIKNKKIKRNGENQPIKINHHFFDEVLYYEDPNHISKTNVKMFNFSKIVDDTEPRSGVTSNRQKRDRYSTFPPKEVKKDIFVIDTTENQTESNDIVSVNTPIIKKKKYVNMSLENPLEKIDQSEIKEERKQGKSRTKGIFPAPFYRIKYQNYQKKKQIKQSQFHSHQEINHEVEDLVPKRKRKNEILFLNIKKFQQ